MEQIRSDLETINNNGFLWTDIQKPTNEKMTLLAKNYNFHELNVEDCLSQVHIPKVDRYEDHVFIILHFPTTAEKEKTLPRFSQLSIFAGRNYLVTIHHGDLKPLDDIFQLCKQSDKQRQVLMGKSPGYLLHSIIDALVDDLLNILKKIIGNPVREVKVVQKWDGSRPSIKPLLFDFYIYLQDLKLKKIQKHYHPTKEFCPYWRSNR